MGQYRLHKYEQQRTECTTLENSAPLVLALHRRYTRNYHTPVLFSVIAYP